MDGFSGPIWNKSLKTVTGYFNGDLDKHVEGNAIPFEIGGAAVRIELLQKVRNSVSKNFLQKIFVHITMCRLLIPEKFCGMLSFSKTNSHLNLCPLEMMRFKYLEVKGMK